MAFVYRYPAPAALTEGEFREQLEANGFEALYVRRGAEWVQFSTTAALTENQETAIGNAIASYSWSDRRELIRTRIGELKTAIAAVSDPATRAALVALGKLVYALLRG